MSTPVDDDDGATSAPDGDRAQSGSPPAILLGTYGPVAAAVIALAALAGHMARSPLLTRIRPDWPDMTPAVAIGLLLGSVAVAAAARDRAAPTTRTSSNPSPWAAPTTQAQASDSAWQR